MSRKDYNQFAAMLASHKRSPLIEADETFDMGYETARMDIGRSLAAVLKLDNERFDAARFYKAADIEQESP